MKCPECGTIFFAAPAWSIDQGDESIAGVKCPGCGAFISDDELDQQDDDE